MSQRKAKAVAEIFEDGKVSWWFEFTDERIRRFDLANLLTVIKQMELNLLTNLNSHDYQTHDPKQLEAIIGKDSQG